MTTEVAIVNGLGVALATDSAATIRGQKVFHTANKLFELSRRDPIGIMIHGNMDFLGVPWEILIKDFRHKNGEVSHAKLEDWADSFFDYMHQGELIKSSREMAEKMKASRESADNTRSSEEMVDNLSEQVNSHIRYLLTVGVNMMRQAVEERESFLTAVQAIKDDLNVSAKMIDDAGEIRERIQSKHSALIHSIVAGVLQKSELLPGDIDRFVDVVLDSLVRIIPDVSYPTGIIFAGFGKTEAFPGVHVVEVDGALLGKLKRRKDTDRSVSGYGTFGKIIPFAQTDVIQRLIGVPDSNFVNSAGLFVERAMVSALDALISKLSSFVKIDPNLQNELVECAHKVAYFAGSEFRSNTVASISRNSLKRFDQMAAMMPIQEVVELAEALISITAAERKASLSLQTVGGPIDVAYITKHGGFKWIKNKNIDKYGSTGEAWNE